MFKGSISYHYGQKLCDHYHLSHYKPSGHGQDNLSKSLLRFKQLEQNDFSAWIDHARHEMAGISLPANGIIVRALHSYETDKLFFGKPLDYLGYNLADLLGWKYMPRIIQKGWPTQKAHQLLTLEQVEQEIMELINNNPDLLRNHQIITSIKGIGPVNAWMTIAYTENFVSFTDARKYVVYVGVVPYDHSSGTSLKGRKRVSHLANKELKQELNQVAKIAVIHDPELRAYANRKSQNKCYPLILNNVKFKLILRMFSLVKRGELYVENYRRSA